MRAEHGYVIYLRREQIPKIDLNLGSTSKIIARELRSTMITVSPRLRRLHNNSETKMPLAALNRGIYSRRTLKKIGLIRVIVDLVESAIRTVRFVTSPRAWLPDFVENEKALGIRVGDIIFDNLIRSDLGFLEPRRAKFRLFKLFFRVRFIVRWFGDLNRGAQVRASCVSSLAPLEAAILARVSVAAGIPVYVIGSDLVKRCDSLSDLRQGFTWVSEEEVNSVAHVVGWEAAVDKYLESRVSPVRQDVESISFGVQDVEKAFRGKQVLSLRAFRANHIPEKRSTKPVVMVSLHCFSDFPHHAGNLLFLDYYSAFTETLEMIAENNDVNWIVKPHPSRTRHGEDGLVEDYLSSKSYSNVILWPEEVSTLSALEWATGFVTVNGTIGIEAACFGKPVLIGGSSNYGHLGFSMVPSTKEEYRMQILQAHTWLPLTGVQVTQARKAMYRYHNLGAQQAGYVAAGHQSNSALRGERVNLSDLTSGKIRKIWLS